MVESVRQQLKDAAGTAINAIPPIIAHAEVQAAPITVGSEFFEYVNRYGPPINGVFDDDLLALVRSDLGITVTPGMYMGGESLALVKNLSTNLFRQALTDP